MSAELQARAKSFLDRPIPDGMPYVSDSLSERFISTYAATGTLAVDPELAELLGLCVLEAFHVADSKAGEEAEFFRESALILQAIQAELQGR